MAIKVRSLSIEGARLEGENPLPFFRDRDHDKKIECNDSFPREMKDKLGYEAGFRVLPYRMQDRYSRKRTPFLLKEIILENRYLKASFLPETGGRMISLVDKTTGRELLCRNPVFQPANLAIRNAWFSGGVEWNIGQIGHTFLTCSSIFAAEVEGKDGERFLRLYDFERCKGLFWQVDLHLPDESRMLYAHVRVINPNNEDKPMYWWTNIAVMQTPEARIFASADDVIYMDPKAIASKHIGGKGFGYSRMPVLPSLPGRDYSYPYNSNFANEYFFQCNEIRMPWEAVTYKDGETFFEVSTERLRYRKMFCWGNHEGGRHWQEYLSGPGSEYIEIQAGLARTQDHGIDMPGGAVWDWTQDFGGFDADSGAVHDGDWFAARAYIEESIRTRITENELYERTASFQQDASRQPKSILHEGSGWGALECERMIQEKDSMDLSGLVFPVSTVGEEQYPWLCLLNGGVLPERNKDSLPGAWMVQREWKRLLDLSLEKQGGRNWYALLHAGVMAFEEGEEDKAARLWEESANVCPSVWAYRNLAVWAKSKGNEETSRSFMKKAWESSSTCPDQALAQEYLSMLKDTGMYDEAWSVFEALPDNIRSAERTSLIAGTIAIELGKSDFLEQLFRREFAVIKEGEVTLTDLWFRYHAERLSAERGIKMTEELLNEARASYPPPSWIDFRML